MVKKNAQVVVLFGDSLLMDAVEASIRRRSDLTTVRVPTTIHNVGDYIMSLAPDIVIFDWDAPYMQTVLSFLRDRPGTPLLGLDVKRNDVIALSSLQYPAVTVNDLANVVKLESAYSGIRQSELSIGLPFASPVSSLV